MEFQPGDFIGVHTVQGTFPFSGGGGSVRCKYDIQGVGSDIDFNSAGAFWRRCLSTLYCMVLVYLQIKDALAS